MSGYVEETLTPPPTGFRVVCLREIEGDPFNVRGKLTGIEALAQSIFRYGLLENLVCVEQPENSRGQWLQLRAGSRRFAAMMRLVETGRWPEDASCHVLIIGSDGVWENLVENISRSELKPWDLGRRLSELSGAGLSHRDIGERIGHSNGWVSRYVQVAQGLAPETIEYLEKQEKVPKMCELFQLSRVCDVNGDPDGQEQIRILKMPRVKKKRRRMVPDAVRAFASRLQYLQADMPVPPLVRPVVAAVINYLESGVRPDFRHIEETLLQTRQRFLQPTRDELLERDP